MGIARPTLRLGMERDYETTLELEELRREIRSAQMPAPVVKLLKLLNGVVSGSVPADQAEKALLHEFTSSLLNEVLEYCRTHDLVCVSGGVMGITEEGIAVLELQRARERVDAATRTWKDTTESERKLLVLEAMREREAQGISAVARAVAHRFDPPGNEGSIRLWINRRENLRSAILRAKAKSPPS
jgi:hypothetical protein